MTSRLRMAGAAGSADTFSTGSDRSRRVFVLLFDEGHLGIDSLLRVKRGAEQFVRAHIGPGDYGGVFANGEMYKGRLTTDRNELLGGIRSASPMTDNRQAMLAPFREFPRIPGEMLTAGPAALPLLDHGPDLERGILSKEPPDVINPNGYAVQIPLTDADGNDVAGVRAPMVQAPLATYTGWNIRTRGFGHGATHEFTGSTMPFPETPQERLNTGDPRPVMPIAFFGILHPGDSARTDFLMDKIVIPRLEAVQGISKVDAWGVLQDSVRILLDEEKVVAQNLNLGELIGRLARDNFAEPLGDVEDGGRQVILRSDMRFTSPEEIAEYPLGNGLRIKDVGEVRRVKSVRDSLSRIDGAYSYFGVASKDSESNVVETSRNFEEALEELEALELEALELLELDDTELLDEIAVGSSALEQAPLRPASASALPPESLKRNALRDSRRSASLMSLSGPWGEDRSI